MSVRINLRLPEELVKRLRVEVEEWKEHGITMTGLVMFAIEEYFGGGYFNPMPKEGKKK